MGVADAAKAAVGAKNGGEGKKNLPAKTPKTLTGYKSGDVSALLGAYKMQIAQALPKHLTAERIIQLATTVITRSPEIKKCTPESVIGAVMNASMLGLDITPQFGQAYFVPYFNKNLGAKECQFMLGYKGWIQLFRNSGEVSTIYAEVVREGDKFDVNLGLENNLVHKPNFEKRGKLIAAYAVIKYKDGGYNFVVLTEQDVNARKSRSQAAKGGKNTPWDTDPEAMWKKSAIRALIPYVPVSVENMISAMMTDGAVVNSDAFKTASDGDKFDIDLDKVSTVESEESEEAEDVDFTENEPEKNEKEDSGNTNEKKEKTEEKKSEQKDEKTAYLECAKPLMEKILKDKGSDYFAKVLKTVGYNNLDEVKPEHYSRMVDALQYEVDNIGKKE